MRREARQHQTIRTQAGVQADAYTEFKTRDRVMTADGYPGRVEAVHDGPFPGAEAYEVTLDGGMGGGVYTASQLKKMADEEYTASKDYPELADILVERPDPGKQVILASKTAITNQGRWAKETRDDMDADARERGHDMEWKGVDLNTKGKAAHYVGECKNCGHSAVAGASWSSSHGHATTDARKTTCPGPGTKWQTEMVHDLMHQRLNDAVGEFVQNVKNEQDKAWLREQGIEASKTATTINHVKVDSHGEAPHEVRADNPNSYDERSTEGDPDPKMNEPLSERDKKGAEGGEIMKGMEGLSFGSSLVVPAAMSPAAIDHIKEREDARQDVIDTHRHDDRDHTTVNEVREVEDPAYARSLDRAAAWNDPEERLDHYRDHNWGGVDLGHGEGGEWHDPEEGRDYEQHAPTCYYKHDGPCPQIGGARKVAMPSIKHPEPEGFTYDVKPSSNYPGSSSHVLSGFVGNHHVGDLHFTRSDDGRAVKVDLLHTSDALPGVKGVGSAMMDALYHEHPEAWIHHGSRTDQGAAWWRQYRPPSPHQDVANHHPNAGWDEYFNPHSVHNDMTDNYKRDPEHNPAPEFDPKDYPVRNDDHPELPLPYDLVGPHWGHRSWEAQYGRQMAEARRKTARTHDDDMNDTLFPGGQAWDRWFDPAPEYDAEDLDADAQWAGPKGGRDRPERRDNAVKSNEEFELTPRRRRMFSENAKTANVMPEMNDEDELLQRNKRLNDAGYNVVSKRLGDPYALVAQAAGDRELGFHLTAAWADVRAKAKRIRTEGKVRVTLATEGMIIGEVQGDHHTYETGIQRLPGQRLSVSGWSCGCKWGAYHWGAADDFSRFAGRMCSHALALQYEAQSRGMFGKTVEIDTSKPDWVPPRVVVKYNPDSGQNHFVRSSAKEAWTLETPVQAFCKWALAQGESQESVGLLLRTAGMNEQLGLFPEPERHEVKKQEPIWYHGTRHELQPGDHIEPGRKSNQGYGQPAEHVYFSSRPEIAAVFAHAADGPEDDYDARPRVYRVRTTGPWEPDENEDWQTGSHQSRHPLVVEAEEPWRRRWTHFVNQGSVNSPWGEPSPEVPVKPYGATSPPDPDENPTSAGPLTAPDPDAWGHLDPSGMLNSSATYHPEPEPALPSTDGDLEDADLEPDDQSIQTMGNQTGGNDEIMDESRTDPAEEGMDVVAQFQASAGAKTLMNGAQGGSGGYSDGDIAARAKQVLALKAFTPAEQAALIHEGKDVRASNLDQLDIAGTHYAELADDDDEGWLDA